jgi:hypothetical protein
MAEWLSVNDVDTRVVQRQSKGGFSGKTPSRKAIPQFSAAITDILRDK